MGAMVNRPQLSQAAGSRRKAAGLDPVDAFVGQEVRRRRRALGISQTELAQAIGVTFQQVQKYEKGANRISASKLLAIANFLNGPVAEFFPPVKYKGRTARLWSPPAGEAQELLDLFARIPEAKVRESLKGLLLSLAAEAELSAYSD